MGSGSKSGGGGAVQGTMSPEAKKMVQSMKEIVSNFPESEIYAVLKECNMDPDAAVQRLLSLDTFHEVKSRKERRKEIKENQDARSWGNNTSSNNGVKGANERNLGRNATMPTSPNDYGNTAYKRENGSVSPPLYSAPSSTSCTTGKTLNRQPSSQGDCADDARHSTRTADGMSSSQQYPGVQSAWSGTASGLVSMADIVKMGSSHGKTSLQPTDICHDVVVSYQSDYCVKAHHISAPSQPDQRFSDPSYVHQKINKSTNNVDQHVHNEEWPAIEQLATTTKFSSLDVSTVRDADIYTNESDLYGDGGNMSRNLLLRDVQVSNGGVAREDLRFDFTKTASASNLIKIPGATSHYDNSAIKDTVSQNAAEHSYERLEGNVSDITFQNSSVPKAGDYRVSSAAVELEHLNLGKEDHVKSSTRNKCIVVFPNNLQALAGDCSHLSFGTYKSSNGGAFSRPPTLDLTKTNMEEVSRAVDGSSTGGLDTRYFGYDADCPTESYSSHKATADARIYDLPISTQPELMQETTSEVTYGREYLSSLSVPDSSFENIQQSSALPFLKPDQTITNQTSLPNEVLGYSNPRQTDLLATSVESLRGSDYLQLAYLASQQLPSRYGSAVSTIGSPAISMAEVAKSGTLLPQQSSQPLAGVIGHELQQHLAHPYPQSSLNVEQLANIIGYPSALPQSQYKPYARESYQGGSSYQSLSDMKHGPQHYKSGASLSNLPLPNANASGYANFGNSANVPGNFLHNPSSTNKNSYEFLLSQYKDANHFNPTLGQNENGLSWDYATNSRTMSSVPSNAYDSFQTQNQQHLGYKQTQQHFAALGYQDPRHSLTGMPQEYQRNDPTMYSQISSSKEQLWQQRY